MFKRKKHHKEAERATIPLEVGEAKEASAVDQPADWSDEEEEGRLSVDVYQTEESIIIKSAIAGVEPEDLDIAINNDMLTIRGQRQLNHEEHGADYLYRECYWGTFSRSIILPEEVDANSIDATIKNGILTVTLPKIAVKNKKKIKIKDHN